MSWHLPLLYDRNTAHTSYAFPNMHGIRHSCMTGKQLVQLNTEYPIPSQEPEYTTGSEWVEKARTEMMLVVVGLYVRARERVPVRAR